MPRPLQKRISRAIDALAADPLHGPQIKPLEGAEDLWRCRVGDFRIIYRVRRETRRVEVATILPRGEAYRRL